MKKLRYLMIMLMLLCGSAISAHAASPDKVHMIKMGANGNTSNAFIIQDYNASTKKYEYALVDTGSNAEEDRAQLQNYLSSHNITKLKYLFLTHNHGDHAGGFFYLMRDTDIKIDTIVFPISPTTVSTVKNKLYSESYTGLQDFLTRLEKYKTKYSSRINKIVYIDRDSHSGIKTLGDGKITYFNTKPTVYPDVDTSVAGYNNYTDKFSLVFRYDTSANGGISYVFTGDIYALTEGKLSTRENLKNADVLQMSHHGSSNANSEAFVKNINPKMLLCSRRECPYNTIAAMRNYGIKASIYGTYDPLLKSAVVVENKVGESTIKTYNCEVYKDGSTYKYRHSSMTPSKDTP